MYWPVILVVAVTLAFWLGRRSRKKSPIAQPEPDTALDHLKATNALLRTLCSAHDIPRSLFELALRIRAIVPCDRVGLALITQDGEGYNTYTARLDQTGPSPEPRPDLHFRRASTIIDEVVKAREGRIIDDVAELAPTFLDLNVAKSAGFSSIIMVPLIFEGDAVGTLNLVSRRPGAFSRADLHALKPVAEALGMAFGARHLADTLARHQMAHELSELTFAFANDMSGAVQAIIGQSELLAVKLHDSDVEVELQGMLQQARRLREILNNMQRMTREKVATTTRPQ